MMQWIDRIRAENPSVFEAIEDDRERNVALFKLCASRLITQFHGTFPQGKEPETELALLAEDAVFEALGQYDPDPDLALHDEVLERFKSMTRITGGVLSLAREMEAKQAAAIDDEMLGDTTDYPKENTRGRQ